jgi:hypothetical protein
METVSTVSRTVATRHPGQAVETALATPFVRHRAEARCFNETARNRCAPGRPRSLQGFINTGLLPVTQVGISRAVLTAWLGTPGSMEKKVRSRSAFSAQLKPLVSTQLLFLLAEDERGESRKEGTFNLLKSAATKFVGRMCFRCHYSKRCFPQVFQFTAWWECW